MRLNISSRGYKYNKNFELIYEPKRACQNQIDISQKCSAVLGKILNALKRREQTIVGLVIIVFLLQGKNTNFTRHHHLGQLHKRFTWLYVSCGKIIASKWEREDKAGKKSKVSKIYINKKN